MNAATATPTDPGLRRPRKDPTRISAQEHMILIRMKRIDRGQGCHAAVDRIGRSFDDRHQSFSPAQTRRHIRRLRELGEIHFAGQTPDGRNVYLFPERTSNSTTTVLGGYNQWEHSVAQRRWATSG